jgi:NhaA family Na+:H+ antiporter
MQTEQPLSSGIVGASRRRFHQFLENDASGGVLLILCTIIALMWANSDFYHSYEHLLHSEISFKLGSFELGMGLLHWVNDGLMAVFFFVVGLEIKREIVAGELSTWKKASLPALGAIGGMVLPALIFVAFTFGKEGMQGWGVPTATDIAFSLGILNLLGKRVPLPLKIFLVALAIVDDLGAIMIIGIFYSSNLQLEYLIQAFALLSFAMLMNWMRVRKPWVYVVVGLLVWYFFLQSGIHASIAGVLVAFTIPIKRKQKIRKFNEIIKGIEINRSASTPYTLPDHEIHRLDYLKKEMRDVQSPLQRLEHMLHGTINYFIMPIFALVNAGIHLNNEGLGPYTYVGINIALALFFGKTVGISLVSYLGCKFKLAELPTGVKFSQLFAVAILGGLGFTMSLFISNLAFTDAAMLNSAKIGVLGGSATAGFLGYIILSKILPKDKTGVMSVDYDDE